MRKSFGACIIFCFACLILTGCFVNKQSALIGKGSASYGLTDSKGNKIELKKRPERIAGLGISMDEILIELLPASRLLALTRLADDEKISNIVDKARQIPKRITANPEQIVYLQPDLLFVPDWQPAELIATIRGAGIPVYVYKSPNTIVEIKQLIAEVAMIVDEEEAGVRLIGWMENELAKIPQAARQTPPEAQPIVVRYGTNGVGGGKGSSFDDLCNYARVRNGAALAGLGMNGQLSKEQLVSVNPDVFIVPIWDRSGQVSSMQSFKQDILNDLSLQSVTAVQQRRLVAVADAHVYSSSQYAVHGVLDISKAVYEAD